MRMLQAEDLRHHVVSGGMQQDPAGGQTHHYIAAHRRQADRDGIWTCGRVGTASLGTGYETELNSRKLKGRSEPNLLV